MRRNRMQREGSLLCEGSLSSTLPVKLDRSRSKFACNDYQSDDSLLVSVKKATQLYNEAPCDISK